MKLYSAKELRELARHPLDRPGATSAALLQAALLAERQEKALQFAAKTDRRVDVFSDFEDGYEAGAKAVAAILRGEQ